MLGFIQRQIGANGGKKSVAWNGRSISYQDTAQLMECYKYFWRLCRQEQQQKKRRVNCGMKLTSVNFGDGCC